MLTKSFFIAEDQAQINPCVRRLSGADYQTLRTANGIIEDAKQRAADILSEAQAVFVAEKTKGYQEGLKLANLEKEAAIYEMVQDYASAAQALENALGQLLPQVLKKMLGDMDASEVLEQYIKASIDELVYDHALTIKVHSKHLEQMEEFVNERLRQHPVVKIIRLERDDSLQTQQVLLETKTGIAVLDLQQQLDNLATFAQRVMTDTGVKSAQSDLEKNLDFEAGLFEPAPEPEPMEESLS